MPDQNNSKKSGIFQREGSTTEGFIPCPEPKCKGQLNYKREIRVYVCRVCGVEQPELQVRTAATEHKRKKSRKEHERDLDQKFLHKFFGKPKKKGEWDDLVKFSKRHSKR
ncbi:MAG: hypothetical protein ACFFB3_12825 [Candidatus Hodarchaeota archaeon]